MQIVRIVRLLLGIRRVELARRSGVSERELARIEMGEVAPTKQTADAIDLAVTNILNERSGAKSEPRTA